MFSFLHRRKAARAAAAEAEAGFKDLSADARRKRVFDRTIVAEPEREPGSARYAPRGKFGLKPEDEDS